MSTLFDKCFAVFALLFFMPFFVLISVVVLLTEGGPVFFAHQRIGKNGKSFKCFKFRTMAIDASEQLASLLAQDPIAKAQWDATQKLDDDPRVTCLGEFFRKTSLDELPQFWNVLKGEMAIVGPRPIVEDEMARYGKNIDAYLSVKPGITGFWQVNGRSDTSYEERVKMDVEYVQTKTFPKDIGIILKTVKVVLSRSGAV
ncbi:sugar transferase [Falsihalocynthiibacter sp. S25ZX9]|uniref:sugar transferase n=1 Tax=Falsihalocynthiibacter sp. S25ZX9 TaxID=3240870 RepID=UPI00350ECA94